MSYCRAAIVVVCLLGALSRTGNAQSATASLTGAVVDPQGEAVSGAEVILTDTARNLRRQTMTNGEGLFTFTQAPPSSYSVRVEHAGFGVAEIPALVLNVNDRSSLPVALFGDDVVDLERQRKRDLWDATVFASSTGPIAHALSQVSIHCGDESDLVFRRRLALDCMTPNRNPMCK